MNKRHFKTIPTSYYEQISTTNLISNLSSASSRAAAAEKARISTTVDSVTTIRNRLPPPTIVSGTEASGTQTLLKLPAIWSLQITA